MDYNELLEDVKKMPGVSDGTARAIIARVCHWVQEAEKVDAVQAGKDIPEVIDRLQDCHSACDNDTDDDGDCHLCNRRGGCIKQLTGKTVAYAAPPDLESFAYVLTFTDQSKVEFYYNPHDAGDVGYQVHPV